MDWTTAIVASAVEVSGQLVEAHTYVQIRSVGHDSLKTLTVHVRGAEIVEPVHYGVPLPTAYRQGVGHNHSASGRRTSSTISSSNSNRDSSAATISTGAPMYRSYHHQALLGLP